MKKLWIMLLLPLLLAGCKNKKARLADEDTVTISDFIDIFPALKLPFQVDDSLLARKETDSATISYKIFTQFVPDSVLSREFGEQARPKIYPLGKVAIKKFETYVFLKAVTSSKKEGYILAFDKENKFITGMPLVIADKDASTRQQGGMDAKYTVTKTVQTKTAGGQVNESKNVYILNGDAKEFSLIVMDEAVSDQKQDIINPIDTLPRHNRFSGDYIKDKRNYVSIRDGRNAASMLFFVHFEKDDGDCKGELKGEATLHGIKTAIYRANGNPCVLEFTFTGNVVTMKEEAACGSYRDIKCFFDGSFAKKKEPKLKTSTKRR
jgi:hypothetical protein